MSKNELNEIIYENIKYPVPVSDTCYPEVEELYLKSKLDKIQIAEFWNEYDYQGVRNALELLNNLREFKDEMIDRHLEGKTIACSPSQIAIAKLMGWQVDKLNLAPISPWESKKSIA
jgi:hypothetical protein